MSDALNKIHRCIEDFSELVDRCRNETMFNPADWQDAYNRLNRLRGRYLHEKPRLTSQEKTALQKVFEEDSFIKGLLNIRVVGEHVEKGPDLYVPILSSSALVPIEAETSAAAFFAARKVTLRDKKGVFHSIDHLSNLTEAEKRIKSAWARTTGQT